MLKIVAFSVLMFFLFAGTSGAVQLPSISLKSLEPSLAEPGGDVKLVITISNPFDNPVTGFSVEAETSKGITIKSFRTGMDITSGYRLCARCKIENTYFLSVSPDAQSGTYPVFFRISKDGNAVTERVDIQVRGKPNIVFDVSSAGLDRLTPKSDFTLAIEVKNIGTGEAREIKIFPQSEKFIPLGSSAKTIEKIPPGKTESVLFEILVGENIPPGAYTIPFTISYKDEEGNEISQDQDIGIRIINKGELNIQSIKTASRRGSAIISAGDPFAVIVRIENVGEGTANFVEAELSCPFSSPKKAFIGQLEEDEDSPAVFDLVSPEPGNFPCNISIKYRDDTGSREVKEKINIEISPAPKTEIIIIAIIVLAIVFIFRRRIIKALKK